MKKTKIWVWNFAVLSVSTVIASSFAGDGAQICKNCGLKETQGVQGEEVLGEDLTKVANKLKGTKETDCLKELGAHEERLLACANNVYDVFLSKSLSFDEVNRKVDQCTEEAAGPRGDKARPVATEIAAGVYFSRLAANLAELKNKVAFGVGLSSDDQKLIDKVNSYLKDSKLSDYAQKQGLATMDINMVKDIGNQNRPFANALKSAGVSVDQSGPDFSKFDFSQFKNSKSLQNAVSQLYGPVITDGLLKLAKNDPAAKAVVIGKSAVIPNRTGKFPKNSHGVTVESTYDYNDQVRLANEQVVRLLKTYLQDTKKYGSFTQTFLRSFGRGSVKDADLDRTGDQLTKTMRIINQDLGIDKAAYRDLQLKVQDALTVANAQNIQKAIVAADTFRKAAIVAPIAATGIGAAAVWGAEVAASGAIGNAVVHGFGALRTMLMLNVGIAGAKAGYNKARHGDAFGCNFLEQTAQSVSGTLTPSGAAMMVGLGMVTGPLNGLVASGLRKGLKMSAPAALKGAQAVVGIGMAAPIAKNAITEYQISKHAAHEAKFFDEKGLVAASDAARREARRARVGAVSEGIQAVAFSGITQLLWGKQPTPDIKARLEKDVNLKGKTEADVLASLDLKGTLEKAGAKVEPESKTEVAKTEGKSEPGRRLSSPEMARVNEVMSGLTAHIEAVIPKAERAKIMEVFSGPEAQSQIHEVVSTLENNFATLRAKQSRRANASPLDRMIFGALVEGAQNKDLGSAREIADMMVKVKQKKMSEGKSQSRAEREVERVVDEAMKSCKL